MLYLPQGQNKVKKGNIKVKKMSKEDGGKMIKEAKRGFGKGLEVIKTKGEKNNLKYIKKIKRSLKGGMYA